MCRLKIRFLPWRTLEGDSKSRTKQGHYRACVENQCTRNLILPWRTAHRFCPLLPGQTDTEVWSTGFLTGATTTGLRGPGLAYVTWTQIGRDRLRILAINDRP
ncbi:hypothetical protein RRG08_042584 [Elysia crispata]|uniref:Uncharacterized protein n=1 Tax=Elysia crispata TaxID=231223 RepID=A0AAE1CK23_9GAST|nr:hypothetical protein RRG08_042584 [Elysia crispata]